jgi:hypothetical protein
MDTLKFKAYFRSISFKVSSAFRYLSAINQIYEKTFIILHPLIKQLVGKIEKEHSFFIMVNDQSKMKNIIFS